MRRLTWLLSSQLASENVPGGSIGTLTGSFPYTTVLARAFASRAHDTTTDAVGACALTARSAASWAISSASPRELASPRSIITRRIVPSSHTL
jgi:hypothetical protein